MQARETGTCPGRSTTCEVVFERAEHRFRLIALVPHGPIWLALGVGLRCILRVDRGMAPHCESAG
jgi:hypothetical protein